MDERHLNLTERDSFYFHKNNGLNSPESGTAAEKNTDYRKPLCKASLSNSYSDDAYDQFSFQLPSKNLPFPAASRS
jgi:hypothetical protein